MRLKPSASAGVIELVRLKIGSPFQRASDAAIARALELERGTVGRYGRGERVMSLDVLYRAQDLLQLPEPEFIELVLQLQSDATEGRAVDHLTAARNWLREAAKTASAASLAVIVMAAGAMFPGEARAASQVSSIDDLYIMRSVRHRFRVALSRFVTWLQCRFSMVGA